MNEHQFSSLKERSIIFRKDSVSLRAAKIKNVLTWIKKHEEDIIAALQLDFNKPRFECLISEILPCIKEAEYTIKNLSKWMSDQKVPTPILLLGHRSRIRYENKGVVLIISPWNYPFQLAIVPLIAAIAAGNTAVIKPSELTPHVSEIIKKLVEHSFYSNEVIVELGDKEVTQNLLKHNFDHVFFTGSTAVGRIINQTCAERLIPVTLELGGKSPTIVDAGADIKEAADKIFWGKFFNRAQTCVAPDYLLVHESISSDLTTALKKLADTHNKTEKARIITNQHHSRLQKISGLDDDFNQISLRLVEVDSSHPSMQEEIFGPVLPFVKWRELKDLHNYISNSQKPLSLYVFSKNRDNINYILDNFQSGGVGINTVMVQFGNHYLPFGGIGQSGHGEYHGYHGFLQMSHRRAVIEQSFFSFLRRLLMPPYTGFKFKILGYLRDL